MEKPEHAITPQQKPYEVQERPPEPEFLRGFNEKEKSAIMSNLGSIELTKGCSVACKFCGFDAESKIRGHISFRDLTYIADRYSSQLPNKKSFMLYWASDPLDYEDGDKDYFDAVELFAAHGIEIFTSTAYPKTKQDLFKRLMEKGYIGRVSVSKQNIGRLEREGWLTLRDEYGTITSPHKAIQEGLARQYEKDEDAVFELHADESYVSAGRAFRAEKPDQIGGIECQIGVLLRTDGFYNDIHCTPTRERRTGVILQKIIPENIKKQLNKDNHPETIDELIKYGIVSYRGKDTFGKRQYAIVTNFRESGGPQKYYVEYNTDNLEIIYMEEVRNKRDEEALKLYVDVQRAIDNFNEQEHITEKIKWTLGGELVATIMTKDIKKSPFYQRLLNATREHIEDFMTAPDWKTDLYKGYVRSDLSELFNNECARPAREDLQDLIQPFKNAFMLARDGVLKDDIEMVDELEKKFMDQLYESLREGIKRPPHYVSRLTAEERRGTIAYLNKVFNRNDL